MANPTVTIIIKGDSADAEKAAERIKKRFAEIGDATDKSLAAANKDIAKEVSQSFASGGQREYLETIRRIAPELKQLQSALKNGSLNQDDYNRRVQLLSPITQKAIADSQQLGKAVHALGDEAEHGSNGFQSMLIKADLVGRGITLLTSKVTEGWQEYVQFGREISNINTILGADGNIDKIREGILTLDPALGSTTELARGMYQALSSGVSAGDSLQFIKDSAIAAKAGVASVFDTVDAGTTILYAYNLQAKDVVKVYDEMFQTVKDGKVEFPQLAQSIGLVANISKLAGISMEEMFAAVAVASQTNRPTIAIEGIRQAISNILKPSKEAADLADSLGIQFDAQALKAKGLSQFLDDVSKATGNSAEKLNVLFGDVQAFNIVASLGGENAQKFAAEIERMNDTAGNSVGAFAKQQESLGAQFDTFVNRIGRGFVEAFTSAEPIIKGVLSILNFLLPVIVTVGIAAAGLKLAWLLLNTEFFTTAAAALPSAIAGLRLIWGAMTSLTVATSSLGAALAVTLGWLTVIGAAVGVLYYAFSNYESAIDKANNLTLESINANSKSLQSYKDLAVEAQNLTVAANETSQAQTQNGDIHERLNAILGRLDPATETYIKALGNEKKQLEVLNNELQLNVEIRKATLEATIRTVADGIISQTAAIETEKRTVKVFQDQIQEAQKTIDEVRNAFKDDPAAYALATQQQKFVEAKAKIDQYSQAIIDSSGKTNEFSQKLGENEIKLIQSAKGLGLNSDQLRDYFANLGYTKSQIDLLTAATTTANNSQNNLATGLNNAGNEANKTKVEVFNLRQELSKLTSASQENVDGRIFNIVTNAKSRAEVITAAKKAKEDLKNDLDLINTQKDFLKTATDIIQPSDRPSGAGAARKNKAPNPLSDFRRENRVISGNAQRDRLVYESAQKYNIDPLLIFAQMTQESSFKKKAISSKGASGLMQLMPETARGLGVKNIFDEKQNIEAGVKYLRQQLDKFGGNTALALAAYNAGPGAVQKFNGIPPYKETQDYVKRIAERYQQLKGGKSELGSNFDYQRNLQENSDKLTKDEREKNLRKALEFYKTAGLIPDSEMLGKFQSMMVEEARKAGTIQPTLGETRQVFESIADSRRGEIIAPTGEIQTSVIRERPNVDEDYVKNLRVSAGLESDRADSADRYAQLVERERNLLAEISTTYESDILRQSEDLTDLEYRRGVFEKENADAVFVVQRRLLSAKNEQFSIEQDIADVQDQIANSGINDDLKIQAAHLHDILESRQSELDAVIAIQHAQFQLNDAMEVSNNEIRAKVYQHLAEQVDLNQSIANGIISTYEAVADQAGKALDKLNEKTKGFLSFLIEPAKAIQRNFLTKITTGILDGIFPGLGAEATKTNNPVARPIVDSIGESNKLLKQIVANTGGGLTGTNLTGGGNPFSVVRKLFGLGGGSNSSGGSSSGTFGGGNQGGGVFSLGSGNRTGDVVDGTTQIFAGDKGRGDIFSNLKNIFSTKDGGIFSPKKNILSGKDSKLGGKLAGIGAIASLIGGFLPGKLGKVVSGAGQGLQIGSILGPWGALAGGIIGGLFGLFGGDPKRKKDKKENIPALQKGFTDALEQLRAIGKDTNSFFSDPEGTIAKAVELRAQIASGFDIKFESKKYQKESQKMITAKLIEADQIIADLNKIKDRGVRARDVDTRLQANFATGVYMDSGFASQYGNFKRRNGLLSGGIPGKDSLPSFLMAKEMVLNEGQQDGIRAAAGYDIFKGKGIPNYASGVYVTPSPTVSSSSVAAPSFSSPQQSAQQGERTIIIENITLQVSSLVGTDDATEILSKAFETTQGEKVLVKKITKLQGLNEFKK